MASERVDPPAAQPPKHKMIAPKAPSTAEQALEHSTRSSTDHHEGSQHQAVLTQFAFINTTSDVQYSGRESRSAARSHVMRNFHRKKVRSKQQSGNVKSPGIPQSLISASLGLGQSKSYESLSRFGAVGSTGSHRFDEKTMQYLTISENDGVANSSSALMYLPRPQQLQRGLLQPPISNLWALPADAHSANLIHYYIQVFAKSFIPMNQAWESAWFQNAMSDPACFHGTLFLSLAHKALLTGNENPLSVECFQHRGEAIRIINERLSDPERRVTDGTIAAIACLAAYETLGGTTTDATIHVNGLQKLVGMRGGLKRLGMDGFLEQFLYWVDLSNATATREKPHFLPFETLSIETEYTDSEAIWKYFDSQWSQKPLEPIPQKSYHGLDVVENRLFHLLRQLTVMAASSPTFISGPNQGAFANLVLLLERQISVAVQERLSFKRKFAAVMYSPSTCLFYIPALITCYMSLRPTPIRSSIYDPLVLRMKDHIDKLVPRQLFDRFQPEFWFWALVFTGAAAMGRPQLAYFQRVTLQLCSLLDVHTWEKAKYILKDYAWADSICERQCKAYWDTLEAAEPGGVEEQVNVLDYVRLDPPS